MAVAGYNIYLGGVKQNTSLVTDLNYALSGLTASTAYNVTVSAVDTAGNESEQTAAVNFTTQAATGGTATLSDDFTGTTIDTEKVTIFNPDPSISFSQNDALILESEGGNSIGSSWNNRAEYLSEFNDKDVQVNISQSGNTDCSFAIGVAVDANNLIAMIKGNSGSVTKIRFIIKISGTNVVDVQTTEDWADATNVRIVINQGGVDLYKSINNGEGWIYLNDSGVSYQQDIGSVKRVYFGIGDATTVGSKTIAIQELKLIDV